MLSRTARGRQPKAELSNDRVPVSEGEGHDQLSRLAFHFTARPLNSCALAQQYNPKQGYWAGPYLTKDEQAG